MARNKGTFSYAANYEVKMQAALDPRVVVETKVELITKTTWPYDGDTIYLYKGLCVSVEEEKALYMLVDVSKALSSDYSGWKRIDAGAAEKTEIVDNLTSDATDKALSAKQGKTLLGKITTIEGKITSIYKVKGSKAKYSDLPTTGNEVGDVWNVEEAYSNYHAGTNFVWNGTEWDALGGSIDLSSYYNKTEVDTAIKVETDRADKEEKRLAGLISTNTSGVSEAKNTAGQALTLAQQNETNIAGINLILNGNNNPNDDITDTVGVITRLEAVEELIGEPEEDYSDGTILSRLEVLENLVTGGEGGGDGEQDQTLLQKVNANTLAISTLQETVGDSTKGLVKAVNTLNGNSSIVGSVDYKIDQAFAWINVQ